MPQISQFGGLQRHDGLRCGQTVAVRVEQCNSQRTIVHTCIVSIRQKLHLYRRGSATGTLRPYALQNSALKWQCTLTQRTTCRYTQSIHTIILGQHWCYKINLCRYFSVVKTTKRGTKIIGCRCFSVVEATHKGALRKSCNRTTTHLQSNTNEASRSASSALTSGSTLWSAANVCNIT